MQDPVILTLISKNISGVETLEENESLMKWIKEGNKNLILYNKIKKDWEDGGEEKVNWRERFSRKNIANVFVQQTLGNFIGFAVGIWVTNSFTHYVLEKKSINNLYGLMKRKRIKVNETPEWAQYLMAVVIGFLVLELINFFFQAKMHIKLWNLMKRGFVKVKLHRQNSTN